MLDVNPHDALWPLWRTWTHDLSLPDDSSHHAAWQTAGQDMGLLGEAFKRRLKP
jgi:hypothetical protein